MKTNIYFIHGWGFDFDFWKPVGEIIKEKKLFNSINYINLGFWGSEEKTFRINFDMKNVFVVHSYGLNWFLKNKIKCDVLINFCSAPSFLEFQKNKEIKKKMIGKMIVDLKKKPEIVLKNFYRNCGIKINKLEFKKMHLQRFLNSLEDLKNDKLNDDFKKLSCKIFSIFSCEDKIFEPSIKKIKLLENKNHNIFILKKLNHAFPLNKPQEASEMILRFIKR